MEIVNVTTAQNIQIGYELAGLGQRIKAAFIDFAILFGVYWVCALFMLGLAQYARPNNDRLAIIITVGWAVLWFLYDLLAEIFLNGQTIGKRVAKIKVISLNGERPGLGQYLLRWVFRLIDMGITAGSMAVVTVSFTDKKQRIGDLVAGTTVVSTKPVTKYADLLFGEPEPGHVTTYPQVLKLADKDITLINDVIRNFNATRNNLLIYKLAHKVKTYLGVAYPPEVNDYQFLEIVVSDYKAMVAGTVAES